MDGYTNKEKKIIKQCNEGPFHTLVTELAIDEFNLLVDKLVKSDDSYSLTSLVCIYRDYNRNKIIDYFINKGDVSLLVRFLNYCYDFDTPNNQFNIKYILDKLKEKNDKQFTKKVLDSKDNYFFKVKK